MISELVSQGYEIYTPLFGNARNDIVAGKDDKLYRVEVKSCNRRDTKSDSWAVKLSTTRSNKTENKTIKFDGDRSDILGIYIVQEDRVVLLNSKDCDGLYQKNIKALA